MTSEHRPFLRQCLKCGRLHPVTAKELNQQFFDCPSSSFPVDQEKAKTAQFGGLDERIAALESLVKGLEARITLLEQAGGLQ